MPVPSAHHPAGEGGSTGKGALVDSFWARVDHTVKVRLPIVVAVALASITVTALVTAPVRRTPGYAPEQPIDFSHRQHAGDMKIDCRYCHTGAEFGRHAGIPSAGICMNCHSVAAIDSPGVARLRALYAEGQPVRWRRIHRLPDFVYFSHDVHVAARIECEQCHGDVATMDVVRQVHPLSMGSCLSCHRNAYAEVVGAQPDLRGPENCSACHR